MEIQTLQAEKPPITKDYRSNVDTSRPFRSVKEAVAIFGERFLAGELYSSPKPNLFTLPKQESSIWKFTPSPQVTTNSSKSSSHGQTNDENLVHTLKKLEVELEETKLELKLLKERESKTEVALASLNTELHKNMSKIAQAEADKAAKARDMIVRMESKSTSSPTLAQVLSAGGEREKERLGGERKKIKKKKPIIPLLGDLLFSARKKGKSTTFAQLK